MPFRPERPASIPPSSFSTDTAGSVRGNDRQLHALARELTLAGYVTLVPHYLGTRKPDPKNGRKNARSYAVWERTVIDTVGFAARRADVDPKRIGVVGLSMGSWVALSVAARDRRVSAVVEYLRGLASVGGAQPRPPPARAHPARRRGRQRAGSGGPQAGAIAPGSGGLYEMQIYPGAGMVSVALIVTTPSSVPSRSSICMSNVPNARRCALPGRGDEKPRRSPCG